MYRSFAVSLYTSYNPDALFDNPDLTVLVSIVGSLVWIKLSNSTIMLGTPPTLKLDPIFSLFPTFECSTSNPQGGYGNRPGIHLFLAISISAKIIGTTLDQLVVLKDFSTHAQILRVHTNITKFLLVVNHSIPLIHDNLSKITKLITYMHSWSQYPKY